MYSDKQLAIMETAETLFAEKGFNGTSVRDIAEKAQVNLAMISYYFGSKEKLLEALFQYRGEASKMTIESIIESPGISAMEKVYLLVDNFMDKLMGQQCFHRIMAREQVLNNAPVITALILDMKKRNLELIEKLIREGQENGEFRANVDIPMMMTTMIGTAHHLVTTKHYYRELSGVQQLGEAEFEMFIRAKLASHLKSLFKAMLKYEI
ncbi:MAG: TetR/AcrR family transcriptional regulator [Chitinophagaceae bacterium]|nr:TetR/AcrR family transcriptional regulator [Chitinophagaceae bacterium]